MTARAREASPARYFWPAGPAGAPRPGLLRGCASASDCGRLRELLHGAWPHANGGWDGVDDGAAAAAAAGTCGGQLVSVAPGRWGRRRLGRGGCNSRRGSGARSPVIERAGARFAECKRMGGGRASWLCSGSCTHPAVWAPSARGWALMPAPPSCAPARMPSASSRCTALGSDARPALLCPLPQGPGWPSLSGRPDRAPGARQGILRHRRLDRSRATRRLPPGQPRPAERARLGPNTPSLTRRRGFPRAGRRRGAG